MQTTQAVAIIGGGASGLLTAIQLLSQSRRGGPRVYLIEKQDTFGFGAAYSTNDPSHLLNVRAGNMSGFPDQPRLSRLAARRLQRRDRACYVLLLRDPPNLWPLSSLDLARRSDRRGSSGALLCRAG